MDIVYIAIAALLWALLAWLITGLRRLVHPQSTVARSGEASQ